MEVRPSAAGLGWAPCPCLGSPTRLGHVPTSGHVLLRSPQCHGSCLVLGGAALPPTAPLPRAFLQVPGGASTGSAQTLALQPPSRTPSPSAGGCGISAYSRGKWEVERLYFNTPLWVGDLEKQLREQECEVQPPPLPAWLLCRRAQGDLYKAME